MLKRTLVAAMVLTLPASSALAQSAVDFAARFPAGGWVGAVADNPVVGCIATFNDAAGNTGREITLADGERRGELRYRWDGVAYVTTYEIDFVADGIAERVSVSWRHPGGAHSHSAGSSTGFSLEAALDRFDAEHDDVGRAVLEYVWHADFCQSGNDLLALFPLDGWAMMDIEATDGLLCAVTFGPTDDGREGYYMAFADGSIRGELGAGVGEAQMRYGFSILPNSDREPSLTLNVSDRMGGGLGVSRRHFSSIEAAETQLGGASHPGMATEPPSDLVAGMQSRRVAMQSLLQFVLNNEICR